MKNLESTNQGNNYVTFTYVAMILYAAFALLLGAGDVSAFTVPTSGFGIDIYTKINAILTGPIGFITAIGLMVYGALQIMSNWVITLLCIVAGTAILKASALVQALGVTI